MKKILVVHTKYRNLGGEDTAVLNEVKTLKQSFLVKEVLFQNSINNFFNDLFGLLRGKNAHSKKLLRNEIEMFSPDVIYIHNTWFKASVSVLELLDEVRIKSYLKLHNYRYICSSTFFASKHTGRGNFCNLCGFKRGKNQIFNKVFEESTIKSFFQIIYGIKYLKFLNKTSTQILVLTNFHRDLINKKVNLKKDPEILNNCLDETSVSIQNTKINQIIYAGRVSKEKGIEELIQSFNLINNNKYTLKIIGDGPMLEYLEKKYTNEEIIFTGYLKNEIVLNEISKSKAAITTTKLVEGQPMFIIESLRHGVPIIVPDRGGLKELLPNKYNLVYKNTEELVEKLNLIQNENFINDIAKDINNHFKNNFSNKKYIESAKRIFNE